MLFGKFCCILRKKICLVCNKIMLGNPHIFLVKTGSRNRFSKKEEFLLSNMKRVCPKCGRVFSQEDGFCKVSENIIRLIKLK